MVLSALRLQLSKLAIASFYLKGSKSLFLARLLESDIETTVHVLADHLPLDPLTPEYASAIAGAHHLSFAANTDLRQRRLDTRTFEVLWDEFEAEQTTGDEPTGLMKLTQTEYYDGSEKHLELLSGLPDVSVIVYLAFVKPSDK